MDTRGTAIFAAILECRSMTVIQYTVEDELPKMEDEADRLLLQEIQKLNSLDKIWLLCHTRIATWHLEQAMKIRDFLEKKRG